MKSVKNFFKLFLETFAWIMVLAVISLFIIRVIEKFVVLDDTWQICIICAVSAGMDGIPKFHNLFLVKVLPLYHQTQILQQMILNRKEGSLMAAILL